MICRNDKSKLKYRKITNMPPHARWQSSLNGEKTVSSGWYFHTVKLNWKVRVINSYLRIWKRKFHIDISLYLKFHLSKLILNRFRPCNGNTYNIYSIEDFIMVTTFIFLGIMLYLVFSDHPDTNLFSNTNAAMLSSENLIWTLIKYLYVTVW